MPSYREKGKNTWKACFRYTNWEGIKKSTTKRGFKTKREADLYEANFLRRERGDMSMPFSNFIELYYEDKKNELKPTTLRNKRHMVETHLIPYFGDRPMNKITSAEVIKWQNLIHEKGYKPTYERMLQNQLNAMFNHAARIYNLQNNPCKSVRRMGKSDADKMNFWTETEYKQFRSVIKPGSEDYVMFEILFWTGMREGELLALTPADFDMDKNTISITKTYKRLERQDVVSTPKTQNSIRNIVIPVYLKNEVKEYIDSFYKMPEDQRLFPIVDRTIQKRMQKYIKKSGVKKIRVHDLRHSHVAYLIDKKVEPLIIKERLGHKDIQITLNTYGHLYPSKQHMVADLLDFEEGHEAEKETV